MVVQLRLHRVVNGASDWLPAGLAMGRWRRTGCGAADRPRRLHPADKTAAPSRCLSLFVLGDQGAQVSSRYLGRRSGYRTSGRCQGRLCTWLRTRRRRRRHRCLVVHREGPEPTQPQRMASGRGFCRRGDRAWAVPRSRLAGGWQRFEGDYQASESNTDPGHTRPHPDDHVDSGLLLRGHPGAGGLQAAARTTSLATIRDDPQACEPS